MCGITAISRSAKSSIPDARTFMRIAALAIEDRGPDATGFAWIDEKYDGWYWKAPKTARQAVREVPLISGMQTVIGHTRWATQGKKSDNVNNHPVVDDGIMLVHNGIIDNEYEIYSYLDKDFVQIGEVDTACIAAMLSRPEHYEGRTVGQMLELLEGDASLAWLDAKDNSLLHLARLQGRPMAVGYTRRGDLVMSSTRETLEDTALWSGVKITKVEDVPEGTYLQVRAGQIIHKEVFTPTVRTRNKYTARNYTVTTVAKTSKAVVVPFDDGPQESWKHTDWWGWVDSSKNDEEYQDREEEYTFWCDRNEDGAAVWDDETPHEDWTDDDWDEYLDAADSTTTFAVRYREWEDSPCGAGRFMEQEVT